MVIENAQRTSTGRGSPRMRPLYDARIGDLGGRDLVKITCLAWTSPAYRACISGDFRACRTRGHVDISIEWKEQLPCRRQSCIPTNEFRQFLAKLVEVAPRGRPEEASFLSGLLPTGMVRRHDRQVGPILASISIDPRQLKCRRVLGDARASRISEKRWSAAGSRHFPRACGSPASDVDWGISGWERKVRAHANKDPAPALVVDIQVVLHNPAVCDLKMPAVELLVADRCYNTCFAPLR